MSAPDVRHLYVHVPFCAHKCEYCAFYSHAADKDLLARYTEALVRELELVSEQLKPRTIFFGGGTPSLLGLSHWQRILESMGRLGLLGAEEWTIECNPATVSVEKARLWRDHGVNRISMGVQSLDERLLDRLGRIHSRDMVFRSYELLRRAGFQRVNLDLMFAIPGQTLDVWRATVDEAMAMGPEHLSTYEVTYEEDTPLYAELEAGAISVDDDLACDMAELLQERAGAGGFVQYEVSNFARRGAGEVAEVPAEACGHNINYWRGGAFRGLGPSASEFVGGVRTRNWSNTTLYCEELEKGRRAIESRDVLPAEARAGEIAAFGLRMNRGWRFDEFEQATGFDLRARWQGEMDELVVRGWGQIDRGGFRLTKAGLRFADAAGEAFLLPS
jgi:oxygen-independent coproporphyrinogen-3 oxidase